MILVEINCLTDSYSLARGVKVRSDVRVFWLEKIRFLRWGTDLLLVR